MSRPALRRLPWDCATILTQPLAFRHAPLWDSYISRTGALSKTYAAYDNYSSSNSLRKRGAPRWQEADSDILGRSGFVTDIIMLAIGLNFFALSVAYAYACERL